MYKIILVLALLVLPGVALAQTDQVRSIEIHSRWGGLGPLGNSTLLIERRSGGYDGAGQPVDPAAVERLIAAINAPALDHPTSENLGFTQEWLNRNAEPGVQEYASFYYSTGNAAQKALYLSSFKDPEFIARLLPGFFRGWHTDDYPRVTIELLYQDGAKVTVSSEAQPLYMLPWEVERDGRKSETFNADIARALAALLPKKFTNRERLAGEGWAYTLASAVMREIKPQWNLLEVEGRAGGYLNQLRGKFVVRSAEINPYHNADYGEPTVNGNSSEKNLHASLTRPDLPANLKIGLVLEFKNGQVANVDGFLREIEKYRALVDQVPWLKEYIATHPAMPFELRFVHDRSFSQKAMEHFAEDMRAHGQTNRADEVATLQNEIALLLVGPQYYQAYWLVLPDHRVILWRYRAVTGLLNWKPENFSTWNCGFQGTCAGAVITPEGALAP